MSARDEWEAIRAYTPARIALGRTGNGLPTARVLEFQLAHARARDAVHTFFDAATVARALGGSVVLLSTNADDRLAYLANPDLGRTLSNQSRADLKRGRFDAALVVCDGLSATGIQAHGALLAQSVLRTLAELKWAPVSIVCNGRVAIGDDIAAALGAEMVAVIIGERPGLSAADSLGIYLTFGPKPNVTRDAERNCISNVRPGGLALDEAAHRLAWLMRQARTLRLTGVGLKEDAPELLTAAWREGMDSR